jgi:hypothetical protein
MLMKRVWGHVLAGVAVLGLGSAAVFACVHNDSSVFIQDVLAPQQVSNGQGCSYTSATSQAVMSSGILDVLFRDHYDPTYLVGNQLVAEANSAQLMTETSTFNVQGAVVRLTDSAGNSVGTGSFTRLAAGTIYPASGSSPSYAPITVTSVIDAQSVADLQNPAKNATAAMTIAGGGLARVVTYVRFFGKTLGGRYVESNEFEFPVDVCSGCLIQFTPQDINPCYKAPNCIGNAAAGTSSAQQSVPCVFGQDLAIDCLQCQAYPACHGAYATAPPVMMDACAPL